MLMLMEASKEVLDKMVFPCYDRDEIMNAVERVEMLSDLLGYRRIWSRPYDAKWISLIVYTENGPRALAFYLTRDHHIHRIAILDENFLYDKLHHDIRPWEQSNDEILAIINQFEQTL